MTNKSTSKVVTQKGSQKLFDIPIDFLRYQNHVLYNHEFTKTESHFEFYDVFNSALYDLANKFAKKILFQILTSKTSPKK